MNIVEMRNKRAKAFESAKAFIESHAVDGILSAEDSATYDEIEKDIISIADSVHGVENIHELKTRRNGISYIIDAHIVVNPHITVTEAHNIATDVEIALREKYGNETQISIHIEPDMESL